VVLHSQQKTFGQTMAYSSQRHSQKIRQEMTAMLALDMLRRWLNDESPYGHYEWLKPEELL
jgi:molybdopterin-biosynthesis enzyme MoeA-like protein